MVDVTKRREVRKLEAKRDDLMVKNKQGAVLLKQIRAALKQTRKSR